MKRVGLSILKPLEDFGDPGKAFRPKVANGRQLAFEGSGNHSNPLGKAIPVTIVDQRSHIQYFNWQTNVVAEVSDRVRVRFNMDKCIAEPYARHRNVKSACDHLLCPIDRPVVCQEIGREICGQQ